MAGLLSASLRPFGTRGPRSRWRGKGASGGRAAASLAAPPAPAVRPLAAPSAVTLLLSGVFLRTEQEKRGEARNCARAESVGPISVQSFVAGRRVGSEAVAAAGEMFGVAVVENAGAVGELGKVEVAAVIDFEEHRSLRCKGDVPGLGADARQYGSGRHN